MANLVVSIQKALKHVAQGMESMLYKHPKLDMYLSGSWTVITKPGDHFGKIASIHTNPFGYKLEEPFTGKTVLTIGLKQRGSVRFASDKELEGLFALPAAHYFREGQNVVLTGENGRVPDAYARMYTVYDVNVEDGSVKIRDAITEEPHSKPIKKAFQLRQPNKMQTDRHYGRVRSQSAAAQTPEPEDTASARLVRARVPLNALAEHLRCLNIHATNMGDLKERAARLAHSPGTQLSEKLAARIARASATLERINSALKTDLSKFNDAFQDAAAIARSPAIKQEPDLSAIQDAIEQLGTRLASLHGHVANGPKLSGDIREYVYGEQADVTTTASKNFSDNVWGASNRALEINRDLRVTYKTLKDLFNPEKEDEERPTAEIVPLRRANGTEGPDSDLS